MGGSCQFHRLVTRNLPQGVETNQQTHWQVWTLLSPVPRLGKFHRLKNGAHRAGACEYTRFVNKQLSDVWKIPIPEGHSISEPLGRRSLMLPSDA